MNRKELIALVRKYLKGKATPEERSFVEAYYRNMDGGQSIDSVLTAEQIRRMEEEMFENINQRIGAGAAGAPERSVSGKALIPGAPGRIRAIGRYAAIAAVLAGLVVGVWLLFSDRANDGSELTTIYSKSGKVSKVTLADGSLVWLNADSRLRFSRAYGRLASREIYLEGEAYFEVAKDGNHPFLVHTKDLTTHVLGTRFNVKAYAFNPDIEVTLLEGRVMLSAPASDGADGAGGRRGRKEDTLYLAPHQKALFAVNRLHVDEEHVAGGRRTNQDPAIGQQSVRLSLAKGAVLVREPAPYAEESSAWRNGQLVFRGATLQDVMGSLARKYNIQIQSDPALLDSPVTATIRNAYSAEDALLEITRQLRRPGKKGLFPYDGDKVQFRKDSSVYYIE